MFAYRCRNQGKLISLLQFVNSRINPILKTIEIGQRGTILGGFFISHNNSVISPLSAGENFRVGPGVVIGRVGNFQPTIGNNVYIAANATVIGNLHIGNNVIIGAGSVVVKDIPDNVVVVGNPARIIRDITEKDFNEIM